jgi:hypothetical protein
MKKITQNAIHCTQYAERGTQNAKRSTLNAVRITLFWVLLLFGFSGQAMAGYFVDGDLIRVVYSSAGTMETATDLGSITNLTTQTYNTNNFSLSALGAGATYANSYVAYFAYTTSGGSLGQVWTSGNSGGQTAQFGATNDFETAYIVTTGLYFNQTGSPAQVTVLISNPDSYYNQMDVSGAGQLAGFIPDGSAEASLAALSSTGYVDQTLYYYQPVNRGKNEGGLAVADIRTFLDGHTALTVLNNTPVAGVCGSSNGTSLPSAPTTNLCSAGTAPAVSGSGPWTWTCAGSNGGATANCSANPESVSVQTYTITATSGANGSVTPVGTTTVNSGGSQTYTITPATGYTVSSVLVDGTSVGAVTTYTFSSVIENHTISATFAAVPIGSIGTLTVGSAPGDASATIQGAYNAAVTGDTIEVQAGTYSESDNFNNNVSVALIGGYNSSFSAISSNSVITGPVTVKNGTVTVQNIIIQ